MGSTPVGISASRGAAILGLSEFQSQFEVWQLIMEERFPPRPNKKGEVRLKEKNPDRTGYPGFNATRGYKLPERVESAPIRWGKAFEDAVIALAEDARGKKIRDREAFCSIDFDGVSCGGGEITCHIDGLYSDQMSEDDLPDLDEPLHEGKTTSSFAFREKWGEPGTDRVPQIYQVQTQHQCVCTKASLNIVSVLVFPETPDSWERMGWMVLETMRGTIDGQGLSRWMLARRPPDGSLAAQSELVVPLDWARPLAQMGYFHQYPVEAKPELGRMLIDAYRHFWDKHVLGEVEPNPSTYEDIRRAFPAPVGTVVCDTDMARWFSEYRAINEETGQNSPLKKRKEHLKRVILSRARKMDATLDEESEKKIIFRDATGKKLGQFDGKTFR